jgi:hypothetical protein
MTLFAKVVTAKIFGSPLMNSKTCTIFVLVALLANTKIQPATAELGDRANIEPPAKETLKASVSVGPSESFKRIEDLNRKIIEEEVQLFRINTAFRLKNGKDRPGKRMRALIYQNINYACTFAGLLVNVAYNFYWYKKNLDIQQKPLRK